MKDVGAVRVGSVANKLNLNPNSRVGKSDASRILPFRHQAKHPRGEVFNGPHDGQTKAAHRTSICPFLLRVFAKIGTNVSQDATDDHNGGGVVGSEEFQVYAWMNDSLREVVNLIKDIVVEARDPRAKLKLQRRSHETNALTEMGVVSSTYHNASDRRTLRSFNFEIGDTIDLTIEQQQPKKSSGTNQTTDKCNKLDDENDLEVEVEGDGDDDQEQEELSRAEKKDSDGESPMQSTVDPSSSTNVSLENVNEIPQSLLEVTTDENKSANPLLSNTTEETADKATE